VVLIDPLDGSSNIDVNASVGTILPFIEEHQQVNPARRFSTTGKK
jgi:fructose-1,6-bisphosphatase